MKKGDPVHLNRTYKCKQGTFEAHTDAQINRVIDSTIYEIRIDPGTSNSKLIIVQQSYLTAGNAPKQ